MMMKQILGKSRVTQEEKKLCRAFRQSHSIDQAQHSNSALPSLSSLSPLPILLFPSLAFP